MEKLTSFFAVPDTKLEEVLSLYREWAQASRKSHEDAEIIRNQLYKLMENVALECVTLMGTARGGGVIAVWSYVGTRFDNWRNNAVLRAEECRDLARDLATLAEKCPDQDVLIKRMWRHKMGDVTLDDVRVAYQALCRAVEWAVAHEAGFAWSCYYPGAEEKLEQKRREREAARAAAAARPRVSPEQEAADLGRLQAEIDGLIAEGRAMAWRAERELEHTVMTTTQRELYLIAAEHLDEIRALVRAWRAHPERGLDQVRQRARASAVRSLAFDTRDERAAFEQLVSIAWAERALFDEGGAELYDADTVRAMADQLASWVKGSRGRRRAIDILTVLASEASPDASPDASFDACERAYRAFADLLERARREHPAAFLVALLVPGWTPRLDQG